MKAPEIVLGKTVTDCQISSDFWLWGCQGNDDTCML